MPYGTVKVDTITFTSNGGDTSVSISGLVQNPTFSGNVTATGTISGSVVLGNTLVSGATVTGSVGQFTAVTGGTAGFTTVTGTTVTGTTANFATVSGTRITGSTAGFTTLTGTTVTGTTARFVTVSGTTLTGNTLSLSASAGNISSPNGTITNLSATSGLISIISGASELHVTDINPVQAGATAGTSCRFVTFTGTTVNAASGVFSTRVSGVTITGASGNFTNIWVQNDYGSVRGTLGQLLINTTGGTSNYTNSLEVGGNGPISVSPYVLAFANTITPSSGTILGGFKIGNSSLSDDGAAIIGVADDGWTGAGSGVAATNLQFKTANQSLVSTAWMTLTSSGVLFIGGGAGAGNNATPNDGYIAGVHGRGTNITGGTLYLQGGSSTGSGVGGGIVLRTSSSSTTGTTSNALAERFRLDGNGLITVNAAAHRGAALSVTAPAKFYTSTGTYTDGKTATSGTVAHGPLVVLDTAPIAASGSSVTYTNASTLYITNAPTAGTNVSITNAYALFVAAGASRFGGSILSSNATAGIGYTTGAGGAVTQSGARTNGVTLNNLCGAITLVSAAGTTTWQSFTVTNSAVAATDTVIVNQKSGTDLYEIHVTAIASSSFRISFKTTGGTTTEQPVFNFSVIKAVAA